MPINTNVIVLKGNITRDSELKYLQSGTAVASTAIAVNDKYKKGDSWVDEVMFIDITIWGKTAEALSQYLVRGKPVLVTGKLKQDRWEKDGQTHTKFKVNVEHLELLYSSPGQGDGGGQGGGYGGNQGGQQRQNPPAQRQPAQAAPPGQNDFTDDIPF